MKQTTLLLIISLQIIGALISPPALFSQIQGDTKQRARTARELAKQGEQGIAKLTPYITDTDVSVRAEAVKSLDDIGGPKTLDLLIQAAKDPDAEIQIRATDGLVNVYLPGFIKTGLSGTLQRAGDSVKGKFSDTNSQIIDAYVVVRPDVFDALGKLAERSQSGEPGQRLPCAGHPARRGGDSAVERGAALQGQPDHL